SSGILKLIHRETWRATDQSYPRLDAIGRARWKRYERASANLRRNDAPALPRCRIRKPGPDRSSPDPRSWSVPRLPSDFGSNLPLTLDLLVHRVLSAVCL